MASNSIYLINKFSKGEQFQDYALFSEAPKVSRGSAQCQTFSNVFQSTTLSRDETWNLGMNSTYYAWCGTSDEKLSTSAKVEVSSTKLAALGTIPASGSSFSIAGIQGRPLLKSKITLTGDAGSFAIETGSAFDCVVGVAAVDDEGSIRPVATVAASAGSIVNIAPSKKFFLAAKSSATGALLDATNASRGAAVIDFSKNAGKFGAIIVHEENGSFTVKYTSQEGFTQAIVMASARKPAPAVHTDLRDVEIASLKQQIQQIQQQLEAALKSGSLTQAEHSITSAPAPAATTTATTGAPAKKVQPFTVIESGAPVSVITQDPYPVKVATTWYKATLPFRNAPGQSRRRDIRDRLTTHMQTLGYTYEGGSIDSTLVAMFSHNVGSYGNWHSIEQASQDWSDAAQSLPKHLKGFMVFAEDFKVIRAPEAKGLWRARGETESRGSSVPASPEIPTLAYSGSSKRSPSPAKSSRSPTPASAPVKALVNGNHGRTSSNTSTKSLTNGVNGHHDRRSSGVKPLTNGVHVNGVKPVTNGATVRKYDYPRVQETAMEAAKRRARAVLQSEGLSEFASGWQVSGH